MAEYTKIKTARTIICELCNELYPDDPCEPADCDWLRMLEEDAVSVPQWIGVKDRLPDVNRTAAGYEEITVIATDGRNVRPMIYERACIRGKAKYRWKLMWDRIYDGKPIVAWMPLPEPTKGDADNG